MKKSLAILLLLLIAVGCDDSPQTQQSTEQEFDLEGNADQEPKSVTLGEFIKGKRIYFLTPLPPQAPKDFKLPEYFWQFGADGTMQFGMLSVNGKALPEGPPGKYTVDALTLKITMSADIPGKVPSGKDTNVYLTFPKAEPAKGDALSLINPKGKKETLTITRVETAKPLSKPPKKDSFEILLLGGDKNDDGKLSREEVSIFPAWKTGFDRFDTNKDGFVDEAEFEAVKASKANNAKTPDAATSHQLTKSQHEVLG